MRFLVFAGDVYYPAGGWGDFKKSFDRLEQAQEYLKRELKNYQWSQIVDIEKQTIVEEH